MPKTAERVAWPPRLVGALFDGPRPFGGVAYLPIGSLTVLLGANSAGKTTTLRALEGALPSLASAGTPEDDPDDLGILCTFFVEVTDSQLEALCLEAHTDAMAGPSAWPFGPPGWARNGMYAPAKPQSDGHSGAWLRTVMSSAPPQLQLDAAVQGLKGSRLLAVRQAPDGRCDLAWCLSEVLARAAGVDGGSGGSHEQPHPVPIAPLGTTSKPMLPTAVAVPRDLDEIRQELRDAVVDCLVHFRWGQQSRWAAARGVRGASDSQRRGTRAWLADPDAETTSVAPTARAVCSLASRLATALAPPFVSATHRVEISIEPFHEWERGGPALLLNLVRDGNSRFPLRGAADGYKVWLQLALLEAITVLRRYLELLDGLLDEAVASDEGASSAQTTSAWKTYKGASALLDRFVDPKGDPPAEQFIALRNVGHRLYMIDEPEQHLHPRLQRSATRWLSEAGTAGASQCIVATHSPHYLRIPGDVVFAYLQRVGTGGKARTLIRGLSPELLSAADEIAAEMGFDRGELITSVSAIVFVEGEADKRFLDAFCGEDLHHAGVMLIPIHGAVNAQRKGLVDGEIVLSMTAAKLAVLLDNLVAGEWQALQSDDDLCRQTARTSKKTELKAMAELLMRAQAVGRPIEPLGIPVADMFDLLDEDILRERFPALSASMWSE